MISYISGKVHTIIDSSVIVLQQGLGYDVTTIHPEQHKAGDTVELFIHFHWNQEQGPQLFGFTNLAEKEVFLAIISCSGIGPKLALSILKQIDIELFLAAITTEDVKTLSGLQGIGTKKAEQLCLQLKYKVEKIIKKHPIKSSSQLGVWQDLQDTLTSLNYSSHEIKAATKHIQQTAGDSNITVDSLLRKALTFLSNQ